ncbi:MAG: TonB-dependent receptor [Bacteroidota bacterium]
MNRLTVFISQLKGIFVHCIHQRGKLNNNIHFQQQIFIAFSCFVLAFMEQQTLYAQHITGNLLLTTADSLGQPIPDVTVVITGKHVLGTQGTVSDAHGRCEIFNIPPGSVSIRLSHIAYAPLTIEHVLIQMGKSTSLGTIKLQSQIVGMAELIISGERPIIDPRSTTYGTNLQSTDIQDLPIDRNYRNTVTLVPQASASYYGDEANISGSTGNENKYLVDGVEVTDPFTGSTGTTLPYNFIQELVVTPGGYGADTRSTLGGLINVITFSGTNEFHGSVFGFYTGNSFIGRTELGLLDPTQGDFSNYDVGFGLGGPIIRDALWFFTAYNPTVMQRDINVPGFGIYSDKLTTHSFAAKLTWKPVQELRCVVTATGDPTKQYSVGRGILEPPKVLTNPDPYLQNITSGGINLSFNGIWMPNNSIMFETNVARVSTDAIGAAATQRGATEIFYVDNVTRTLSGGIPATWNAPRITYLTGIKTTLHYGNHTLKTGIEYKDNSIDNQYRYHSYQKYGNSTYYEYIGEGYGIVHHRNPSLFIQDSWQLWSAVNIHGGIRWDGQYMIGSNGVIAQEVAIPLQPRFGFVIVTNQENTEKIYGSAGRYAQELALMLSADFHSAGGYNYSFAYNHDPRDSATGGIKVYNNTHTIRPKIPDLRGQFFDGISLGYERVIGMNIRVGVQGVVKKLGDAVDNVFLIDSARHQFGNLGSGILSEWPKATREYTALIFTIQRHNDEHVNFLASYVLSRDRGNYEGLFDAFNHNGFPHQNVTFNDLNTARVNATGLVPNDRTHVFKFSGSYRFPFGMTTGISFIAQSGTPLSEYAYSDYGIRFLSPRGSQGRTPSIWDLNARLIYKIPYSSFVDTRLILDLFHIASQRKPVDINQARYRYADPAGNVRSPNSTYGKAYRYQPPMSGRLGVEMDV